jgi:hypothetical protein
MLKAPQLDDMSYEKMMQRAISRIPGMTDEWTDFNYHDPGITVLSNYAWLVDMLNYYMDATGDIHILKYLKLLGLNQQLGHHGEAYMGVHFVGIRDQAKTKEPEQEHFFAVTKGQRFYAGDICFEAAKSLPVKENPFISYISEIDGNGMDLSVFAGQDGEYADLFAEEFQDTAMAYFGFAKELSGTVVLQVCIKENENRAPFEDDFFMSSLTWQYYGANGWTELDAVTDLTNGFLRGGMIELQIPDATVLFTHEAGEVSAHYLRCILHQYTYDSLPKLGRIFANPFLVRQERSISKIEHIIYHGESELVLPFYIPEEAHLMIAKADTKGNGQLLYSGEAGDKQEIEIEPGQHAYERVLVFPSGQTAVTEGDTLAVFCVEEFFRPDFRQGMTDGCASQEISFPYPNIYEIGLSTWRKEADGCHRYEMWNYIPDLSKADYMDQVFSYDFAEQKIIFGDGFHGKIPGQGQQLCITKLSVSEFMQGNVLENEINRCDSDDFSCRVSNLQKVSGGRNLETVSEMLQRLEQLLFDQQRLVSSGDYEKIVKQTPGLLIESLTVLPGEKYAELTRGEWDKNEVVVVVKPYSEKKRPPLSAYYKEKILEYLEDKRLINTKVTIVAPTYVGIEVRGRIQLTSLGRTEQQEVLDCLEEMLQPRPGENGFGRGIIRGKIYARLEMLPQVRFIHELAIERTGNGAIKNQRGDILLEERSLSYINVIEIEFC